MRVLVQRSKNSSVKVDNKVVGSINSGLVLLVGFTYGDNEEVKRSPYLDISPERAPWLELNRKQNEVLTEILNNKNKI